MQKLLLVAHGLGIGGAERVSSILANGFVRRGYEVTFLAVYNDAITYQLDARVKYYYLENYDKSKIKRLINRSRDIYDFIVKHNPDVIVSFVVQEMAYTIQKNKYRIVFSERTDPASKPLFLRLVTKYVYRRASRIVFQTPDARDFFGDEVKQKSIVILNPVEGDLPKWEIDNCEKAVVTACRISEEKNLDMLIVGFSEFFERHTDYVLKIYGSTEDIDLLNHLKELVKKLNLDGKVLFPGYTNNIHAVLKNAAIFALTSNFEGLSNSMLEALCIGIPTICTDCPIGGAAMIMQNGVNGYLIPVNDHTALCKRMSEVADSRELQLKLSRNSMQIRKKLDVEMIVDQWEMIIR